MTNARTLAKNLDDKIDKIKALATLISEADRKLGSSQRVTVNGVEKGVSDLKKYHSQFNAVLDTLKKDTRKCVEMTRAKRRVSEATRLAFFRPKYIRSEMKRFLEIGDFGDATDVARELSKRGVASQRILDDLFIFYVKMHQLQMQDKRNYFKADATMKRAFARTFEMLASLNERRATEGKELFNPDRILIGFIKSVIALNMVGAEDPNTDGKSRDDIFALKMNEDMMNYLESLRESVTEARKEM